MTEAKMGQVQLRIMRLLWKMKRATARELTESLNQAEPIAHSPIAHSPIAHSPIAHSTVQTLLRQLEAKGSVAHEKEQRTFYFYPLVKEEKVKKSASRELIQNVFGGNVGGLVSYLLENETISSDELAEIRKLIDQKKNNQ